MSSSLWRWLSALALSTALLAGATFLFSTGADAKPPPGKGGGGGGGGDSVPPAPGIIYFTYDGQPWAMDGDGANKRPDVAEAPGRLSQRKYGGYHWALYTRETNQTYDRVLDADGNVVAENVPHRELFAARPDGSGGWEELQVTDLYGTINASFAHADEPAVNWSNDGEDSFASYRGVDLSDAFRVLEDGTTVLDGPELRLVVVRVPVSGTDLDQYSDVWIPLDSDDPWSIVLESTSGYENNFEHTWSPDGTQIAYLLNDPPGEAGEDLYVTDLETGATRLLWDVTDPNKPWTRIPSWQPTGSLVAYWYDGDIFTVDASGGESQRLVEGTAFAFWSPDGQHMVSTDVQRKGFDKRFSSINRFDLATGETHSLSSDLDKSLSMGVTTWAVE